MKSKNYWLCQIGGWGIYGFYETWVNFLSGRDVFSESRFTVFFVLYAIVITHLYRILIIQKFQWINLPLKQLVKRVAISSLIIGSLLSIYMCVSAMVLGERAEFHFYFFLVFLTATMSWSLSWNLIYFLWKYINSNEELEIEKMKMKMSLKDLELKNIKLNLQPHFIFNALNSIRSLIFENQEKAREAVMQLSNILRNSLITEKEELVLLEKELKIIEDYLALEGIRYEERLKVKYTIDKNCLSTLVPPMMLQTLVENAIKHGISQSSNGGFINIDIFENINSKTIIKIENTGVFSPKENSESTNFGLNASLIRLNYLFGKLASFSVSNSGNDSVLMVLEIPN
jgi:two-component system, LytTR family, sensor kinase